MKLTQLKGFFMREFDFRKRTFLWQFSWFFYDLMWALSVGFLAIGTASLSGQEASPEFMLYLLVGTFIWTYLNSVFAIVSWSITWERWEETIEYTFMAPVKRVIHLFGNALFAIMYGIVRMVIVFALCSMFFDFSLANANFLSAVVILAVGSVAFIGLGMMAAVLPLISPEQGEKAPIMIEAFIMMVSGIFYPIAVLPEVLQWFGKISPATYALEGIRKAFIDGAGLFELRWMILFLVILGIVLIPLGTYIFTIGENYAKRTGKLKRHG